MKRKQYSLLVALTLLAGLVGGAMSNRVFMAEIAAAQETKQHEEVIIAEEFRLVDESGKTRVVLGTGPAGTTNGVWVYDEDGNNVCASLGVHENGEPFLGLINIKKLSLCVADSQLLSFTGTEGKVSIGTLGSASLSIGSSAGNSIKLELSRENKEASVILFGKDFKTRAALVLESDGSPSLKLYDRDGMIRSALGSAEIEIIRTGEARKKSESSLLLFDKDGKVIWSAP